ncbi:MAG: glycosyltransferase [Bacteroidetes bacterium]|nr:glycosyltransferase [Bacteroidota bacterium]
MAFKHFIISRFNLRPIGRPLASDDWMSRRWDLFMNSCWTSVRHQTNQNFTWLMFFDIKTTDEDRMRINELRKSSPTFEPIFIDGAASFNQEVIKAVKGRTGDEYSHIITTRLDNDDAIHESFVQTIQSEFKGQDEALIDIVSGYSLWTQHRTLLARIEKPLNPFLSLVERNGLELTTVSTRNHDHWSTFQNRTLIKGRPLWVQIIHGENQASQFGHKGWLVERGYLSKDMSLLQPFHLDMKLKVPPSLLFHSVYNLNLRLRHLVSSVKSRMKHLLKGQ